MAATRRTWMCLRKLLENKRLNSNVISHLCARCCSSNSANESPAFNQRASLLFIEPRVQDILQKITRHYVDRLFKTKREPLDVPEYKLLTDRQLQQAQEAAMERVRPFLQPPPVLSPREPTDKVISADSSLDKHDKDDAKLVFTDISFGLHDRDRLIVVREPGGVLRHASWEERHRMNQIYHPTAGRKIHVPKVFQPEFLEAKLEAGSYVYILDRAAVQFDPDDPEYIRVVERTYNHVNDTRQYDELRSTRHFGNMAFYLVCHRRMDYLLVDTIQRDYLSDAADLVHLFAIVHPDSETAKSLSSLPPEDSVAILKCFIQNDALHGEVELALESYLDERDHSVSS